MANSFKNLSMKGLNIKRKNLFLSALALRWVFLLFASCLTSPLLTANEDRFLYYPQEPEIAEYIENMPWELYGKYDVPNLGSFWVDNAKDCVKDTIKMGNIWEPYIINILKKYVKPGDRVIDIGAHMGTISMALSNFVGENGIVYSFEGDRQFFRELVENAKLNNRKNIIPHLCWIGDVSKKMKGWSCNPIYSPVCATDNSSWELEAKKLDEFGFEDISLMKIDVECTEDSVLNGAQELIARCRPYLVIEIMGGFGGNPTPEVKSRINHTISILESMDYRVTKILTDDYFAVPKEKLKK